MKLRGHLTDFGGELRLCAFLEFFGVFGHKVDVHAHEEACEHAGGHAGDLDRPGCRAARHVGDLHNTHDLVGIYEDRLPCHGAVLVKLARERGEVLVVGAFLYLDQVEPAQVLDPLLDELQALVEVGDLLLVVLHDLLHLLAVHGVVDLVGDAGARCCQTTRRCNAQTHGRDDQRGSHGDRSQGQTGDGGDAPDGAGGAAGDLSDLRVLVELVQAVGDGVEVDDVLPEGLGTLREQFVENTDAFLNFLCGDSERPEKEKFSLEKFS